MDLTPQPVTEGELAFGGDMKKLLPPYDSIPREFKNQNQPTQWNKLFSDWFYRGLKSLDMDPKEGINVAEAMSHVQAIMGSWAPKHEHKEAGIAYLLSQWFENPKWEARDHLGERLRGSE